MRNAPRRHWKPYVTRIANYESPVDDECYCRIVNGELVAEYCCPYHGDEKLEAWTDEHGNEIIGRPE